MVAATPGTPEAVDLVPPVVPQSVAAVVVFRLPTTSTSDPPLTAFEIQLGPRFDPEWQAVGLLADASDDVSRAARANSTGSDARGVSAHTTPADPAPGCASLCVKWAGSVARLVGPLDAAPATDDGAANTGAVLACGQLRAVAITAAVAAPLGGCAVRCRVRLRSRNGWGDFARVGSAVLLPFVSAASAVDDCTGSGELQPTPATEGDGAAPSDASHNKVDAEAVLQEMRLALGSLSARRFLGWVGTGLDAVFGASVRAAGVVSAADMALLDEEDLTSGDPSQRRVVLAACHALVASEEDGGSGYGSGEDGE